MRPEAPARPRRLVRTASVALALVVALAAGGANPAAVASMPRPVAPNTIPARLAPSADASSEIGVGDRVLDAGTVAAVTRLLEARSEAVRAGDTEAMDALVDPEAPEEFRRRQQMLVTGWAALPGGTYGEELARPAIDLTPPSVAAAAPPGGRVMVVEVVRRQRFDGYDPNDNVTSTYLTLVDRTGDDAWTVAGDEALRSVGVVGERYLWELFEVGSVATDRVLVIGTSGESELRRLAAEVEAAIDRFDAVWERPWWGRVVVLNPGDVGELEALLDPTVEVSKFVAFTTLRVDRTEGWEVAAPRLVIQRERFRRRSEDSRVRVLVHELAHVATVADSGPMTPLWVHEGLASWVEKGRPVDTSADFGGFPDSHEFRTGSRGDIAAVYAEARDDMAALAGSLGPDGPVEFFDRLGAVRIAPGTPDHHLNRILDDLLNPRSKGNRAPPECDRNLTIRSPRMNAGSSVNRDSWGGGGFVW